MKRFILLVFAFLALALFEVSVNAANNVSEIQIQVNLRDDGSAYIVQIWDGSFGEGTENYIPIRTDGIEISDFRVSDENGEYTYVEDWDIDASFEEKAGKCGINKTGDGIELCFGITDYGRKRYAIEYIVKGFIKAYEDYDGTNFMLINSGMNTFPTDATVCVTLENGKPLNEETAGIWGFGYGGMAEFRDGEAWLYTSAQTPLEGSNSMIMLLQLDKGILSPEISVDKSFESVKEKAFEGSDYSSKDVTDKIIDYILYAVLYLFVAGVIIYIAVYGIKRKIEIRKFYKNAPYYRQSPCGGRIETAYSLSRDFDVEKDESTIIGAVMLRMVNNGSIIIKSEEEPGFFGKSKKNTAITLKEEPSEEIENRLYNILKKASGENEYIDEKELSKYFKKRPGVLRSFIDDAYADGKSELKNAKGYARSIGKFIGNLSDTGKQLLAEVMGLKKYLLDFSLIGEREISESVVWQDYMVYATLFGIADKVLEQFKKVYPERIAEFEAYDVNMHTTYICYSSMYRALRSTEQAKRSGGAGGASSFGGGGGFSGGGVGGGSR